MLFTRGSWVSIYELLWKEFESHQRWLTLPVSNVFLTGTASHTRIEFSRINFHVWDWSSQLKSQIVRIPLQSFIPCLFSLLVAIKLKPKIVSQGELIVNLRRNCRILFTMCQTSKHLILALLNILQDSVRVPCARAVT